MEKKLRPRSPWENERILYKVHGVVEDILFRLEQHDLNMQVCIDWCAQLTQMLHAPPLIPFAGSSQDMTIQFPANDEEDKNAGTR